MNDRQEQLDQFAAQQPMEGQVLAPAIQYHSAPPALVHGAQLVLKPRNIQHVLQKINLEAQAGGPAWFYSIPFKNRQTGQTEYVEGPTIKLANAVANIYGNCNVDPWCSSEGLDYWEISARFIDLESGFAMTRQFRQRKNAAKIGGGSEAAGRNMEASFSTGESKAIRNVIVNALGTYCTYAFEQARDALVQRVGKNIEKYRKETAARIAEMVDIRRVEAVIGRPVKDWVARDIAKVIGMGTSISDGMASVNDVFPPIQRQEHGSTEDQLSKAGFERDDDGVVYEKDSGSGNTSQPDGAGHDAPEGAADGESSDSRMADDTASTDAAPDLSKRTEATDKLLRLATDDKLTKEARLSALEAAAANWEEFLDPPYFEALVKTAIAVAKGHNDEKGARKTLGTFK
jgi:hypothetical protein